jgi:anti-anti-sigma factor
VLRNQEILKNLLLLTSVYLSGSQSIDGDRAMLKLEVNRFHSLAVVQCSGRIVAGKEAEALERVALKQDASRLLLDLSGISAVDARGLGVLTEIRRHAVQQGIDFALLNPSTAVLSLMSLMKLDSAIPVICETIDAVVAKSVNPEMHSPVA